MPEGGAVSAADRWESEVAHGGLPTDALSEGGEPLAFDSKIDAPGAVYAEELAARTYLDAHTVANPFVAAARARPAGVEDVLNQFRGRVAAIQEHSRECLAAAARREAALRRRVVALTSLTEQYRSELGRLEEVHLTERKAWESRFRTAHRGRVAAEADVLATREELEEVSATLSSEQARYDGAMADSNARIAFLEAQVAELVAAKEASDSRAEEAERRAAEARGAEAVAQEERDAATANERGTKEALSESRAEFSRLEAEAEQLREDLDSVREALGRATDNAKNLRERASGAEASRRTAEEALAQSERRCGTLLEDAARCRTATAQATEARVAAEARCRDALSTVEALRQRLSEALEIKENSVKALQDCEKEVAAARSGKEHAVSAQAEAIATRDDLAANFATARAQIEEGRRREAASKEECERLRNSLAEQAAAQDEELSDAGSDSGEAVAPELQEPASTSARLSHE
jgi:hypothetical protein